MSLGGVRARTAGTPGRRQRVRPQLDAPLWRAALRTLRLLWCGPKRRMTPGKASRPEQAEEGYGRAAAAARPRRYETSFRSPRGARRVSWHRDGVPLPERPRRPGRRGFGNRLDPRAGPSACPRRVERGRRGLYSRAGRRRVRGGRLRLVRPARVYGTLHCGLRAAGFLHRTVRSLHVFAGAAAAKGDRRQGQDTSAHVHSSNSQTRRLVRGNNPAGHKRSTEPHFACPGDCRPTRAMRLKRPCPHPGPRLPAAVKGSDRSIANEANPRRAAAVSKVPRPGGDGATLLPAIPVGFRADHTPL